MALGFGLINRKDEVPLTAMDVCSSGKKTESPVLGVKSKKRD